MAATGFTHEVIASCLGTEGICRNTLEKHFAPELATAHARANAAVANKCYQMAMAGDPPAATFFWLKCRAGWKEVNTVEHSGPGGTPIEVDLTVSPGESIRSRIAGIAARLGAGSDSPQPDGGGTPEN